MAALLLMLKPIHRGWAVILTDGRELARFTGPAARLRALRFVNRASARPATAARY